ncbi:hypothetical protein [Nocardia pneumoniae]|uniref:hypothetical protein n=1 Tax=Nocardia pneumoniae TaxID=228601 RepID=UPI00030274AC|nr:hypothetical protein [Nocardia pneumoniae]
MDDHDDDQSTAQQDTSETDVPSEDSTETTDPFGTGDETTALGLNDLITLATDGEYNADGELERLYLEDGAAYECADLCTAAINGVDAVRWFAGHNGFTDQPFSNQPSGTGMADKFNLSGTIIADGLEMLGSNLRALQELFVAAQKAYEQAEGESAAHFGKIGDVVVPPTLSDLSASGPFAFSYVDYTGLFAQTDVNPYGSPDSPSGEVLGFGQYGGFLKTPSGSENPYDLSWGDLYELGEDIRARDTVSMSYEMARNWASVGNAIPNVVDELIGRLKSVTQSKWEGPGSAQAFETVNVVVADAWPLSQAALALSGLYAHVAACLDKTQEEMPPDPDPPTTLWKWNGWNPEGLFLYHSISGVDDDEVNKYREYMEDYYESKFEYLDDYVPEAPLPENRLGGDYGGAGAGTGDQTTQDYLNELFGAGDDGGSSGSGGGLPAAGLETAGYESADPGALSPTDYSAYEEYAAQQEEAARAQEEAARQQAEQQAASAMPNALGQGIRDAASAAQQLANPSLTPSSLATPALPSGLDPSRASSLSPSGLRGGGAGSGVGSGTGTATPKPAYEASKLFPRASIAGSATSFGATASQISAGPTAGMPGSPGAAGAPGARNGQENKHERPQYLTHADNMDEALGEAVDMTRPVVGEAAPRPESTPPPAAVVPSNGERPPAPVAPRPSRRQAPPRQEAPQS